MSDASLKPILEGLPYRDKLLAEAQGEWDFVISLCRSVLGPNGDEKRLTFASRLLKK